MLLFIFPSISIGWAGAHFGQCPRFPNCLPGSNWLPKTTQHVKPTQKSVNMRPCSVQQMREVVERRLGSFGNSPGSEVLVSAIV